MTVNGKIEGQRQSFFLTTSHSHNRKKKEKKKRKKTLSHGTVAHGKALPDEEAIARVGTSQERKYSAQYSKVNFTEIS
jgi:hypothetical protein